MTLKLLCTNSILDSGKGLKIMKLEELLGEELYKQVQSKIEEHNAKETDKLKHVKYADLSEGEYVGKGKYDSEIEKLNNIITGKDTQLDAANKLIADMKKASNGNDELQRKITDYETQVLNLQKELQKTKINAALKVALLGEKAVDIDYLTFKLNEKLTNSGENLELDENENIKGIKERIDSLKVQFPLQFEDSQGKKINENKWNKDNRNQISEPKNLAEALQMQYEKSE